MFLACFLTRNQMRSVEFADKLKADFKYLSFLEDKLGEHPWHTEIPVF